MAKPDHNLDDLDQQIEAYRDGQADDAAQRRLEEQIATDPKLAEQVELAERVDESLQRSFTPPAADLSFLQERLNSDPLNSDDDAEAPTVARSAASTRRSRAAYLAIAASVAWVVVATQLFWAGDPPREVAFRERPLTEIYTECVAEGFKPYWVCDDDVLFGATFERRQGVSLRLEGLPEGKRMVGLSYLAGLSRKSTSFLALVDDVPVVVFIDRLDRDWNPPVGAAPETDLIVKRAEKEGLVFYEVSPFEEAYFVKYLTAREP